ncbi:MAG: glycine--tRNA ligase [Chloroflexi bacterium]|nr:glycine--tRNA ligase [Chloroflexota bacterium]
MIDLMVTDDKFPGIGIGQDIVGRVAAAGGIVAGCGTLALGVLARMNRKVEFEPFSPELSEITVVCPRCRKKQPIRIGDSACAACELRISIRIEEPRCPQCDYLLYGLTSDRCPECGGELGDPRQFNLMFRTHMGPVEETANEVYLRPETAQGIFVNFTNVVNSSRKKLPFGIAQMGKAFRNEITPGNFTFRTREFEQMEVEYFVKPGTNAEWLDRWVQDRLAWYVDLGIRRENLRLRRHASDELAHYANDCYDIEYHFPWGWAELEGIADRTDYDLRQHAEGSGEDLTYFDDETQSRYFPYVIEPSGGVDRAVLAFWLDSYDEEPDGNAVRVVLHLHRKLAPVTVAILPLSRNEKLVPTAREVYAQLRRHFSVQYDDAQSIGRRYRRQDEIGTPYCVTVDFDSLEDHQVTIRDRDTMHQTRLPIADLVGVIQDKLEHGW